MSYLPEHAPQAVQPGLEHVDHVDVREKRDPYVNSYGPEVAAEQPPTYPQEKQRRNPFGLSPLLFALLVGIVTALIVGAAVGGGVGGALASCQSSKSKLQIGSSSTSPAALSSAAAGFSSLTASATSASSGAAPSATGTLLNYAPVSIFDVDTLKLDCPNLDGQTRQNGFKQNYKYTCGRDSGVLTSSSGGNITILAAIIAYAVEDCANACSAITYQSFIAQRTTGPTCSSFSFFANAKDYVGVLGTGNGNCFLKNGTLAAGVTGTAAPNMVTAELI